MSDSATVVSVPAAGSVEEAYARFAYQIGDLLTQASEEAARRHAALIEEALAETVGDSGSEMAGSYLRATRALLTGWVDALAVLPAREEHRRDRGTAKRQLLEYLVRTQRAVRPRDLEAVLSIRPESRSRVLAQLVADGLVERLDAASATDDGRAVRYRATSQGADMVARGHELGLPPEPVSEAEVASAKVAVARKLLLQAKEERRAAAPVADALERTPATLPGAERVERVLAVAASIGDELLVVDALGEQATALRQAGMNKRAAHLLDSAMLQEIATSKRATASYAKGREAYERGRLLVLAPRTKPRALEAFMEAEELLTPWADAPIRVWNAVALSEWHRTSGNVLEALDFASLAHDVAERGDDDFARARTSLRLAFMHRLLGQAAAASSAIDRAETVALTHGYQDLVVECAYHRGETLRYRGKVREAKPLLRKAVDAMETSKRPRRGWAFALSALGACLFDEGNITLAETVLTRALGMAKTSGWSDAEALTARRLGVLYSRQNQFDNASDHLRHALTLYSSGLALNLIGQLECTTALSLNASSRKESLKVAEQSLERLAKIDLAVSHPAKPAPPRMSLVDRWVYTALVETSGQVEEPEVSPSEVKELWTELHHDGIAAYPNVQHGISPMGKEPALVAV